MKIKEICFCSDLKDGGAISLNHSTDIISLNLALASDS